MAEAPEGIQTDENDDSLLVLDQTAEGDFFAGVVIDIERGRGGEDVRRRECSGGGHGDWAIGRMNLAGAEQMEMM